MRAKPITFLIVDDDDVDRQAIERALLDIKISNPTEHAKDGVDALEKLRGENGYDKIDAPLMILLDLNMPRLGGLGFLEELSKDETLKDIQTIVLTTSDSDQDIISAYKYNIHGYVVKSDLQASLQEVFEELDTHCTIVAAA